MGNILTHRDERGNVTTNTYSPMGFLTHVTDAQGGISYFGYDLAGRLTTQVSLRHYTEGANISNLTRRTFSYDTMDRVIVKTDIYRTYGTTALRTVTAECVEYDKNGSILKTTDALNHVTLMTMTSRADL